MSTSSKKKNSGVQKKIREEIYTQSTNTNGEKLTLYKQRSQQEFNTLHSIFLKNKNEINKY